MSDACLWTLFLSRMGWAKDLCISDSFWLISFRLPISVSVSDRHCLLQPAPSPAFSLLCNLQQVLLLPHSVYIWCYFPLLQICRAAHSFYSAQLLLGSEENTVWVVPTALLSQKKPQTTGWIQLGKPTHVPAGIHRNSGETWPGDG